MGVPAQVNENGLPFFDSGIWTKKQGFLLFLSAAQKIKTPLSDRKTPLSGRKTTLRVNRTFLHLCNFHKISLFFRVLIPLILWVSHKKSALLALLYFLLFNFRDHAPDRTPGRTPKYPKLPRNQKTFGDTLRTIPKLVFFPYLKQKKDFHNSLRKS